MSDNWIVRNLENALQVMDYVLLILFFRSGSCKNLQFPYRTEKKSEYIVKLFVHIAIAKGLINHGM